MKKNERSGKVEEVKMLAEEGGIDAVRTRIEKEF
jgi:hypothetical protein